MFILIIIGFVVLVFWLRNTSPNRSGIKFDFASFGDRFVADFIDGVLAALITIPFLGLSIFQSESVLFKRMYEGIAIIVFLYNMTYLVGKHGQSWGRKSEHIKVVDYAGNPIGFFKTLVRNVLALSISSIFYLGFLWIFCDKERQAWHDKIMKTYVVTVVPNNQESAVEPTAEPANAFSISSSHRIHGLTVSASMTAFRMFCSDSPNNEPNNAPTSNRSSGSFHRPESILAERLLPVPGIPINAAPRG